VEKESRDSALRIVCEGKKRTNKLIMRKKRDSERRTRLEARGKERGDTPVVKNLFFCPPVENPAQAPLSKRERGKREDIFHRGSSPSPFCGVRTLSYTEKGREGCLSISREVIIVLVNFQFSEKRKENAALPWKVCARKGARRVRLHLYRKKKSLAFSVRGGVPRECAS